MTPSSNGPIASPNLHSIVPYSTVVHETLIIGHWYMRLVMLLLVGSVEYIGGIGVEVWEWGC